MIFPWSWYHHDFSLTCATIPWELHLRPRVGKGKERQRPLGPSGTNRILPLVVPRVSYVASWPSIYDTCYISYLDSIPLLIVIFHCWLRFISDSCVGLWMFPLLQIHLELNRVLICFYKRTLRISYLVSTTLLLFQRSWEDNPTRDVTRRGLNRPVGDAEFPPSTVCPVNSRTGLGLHPT